MFKNLPLSSKVLFIYCCISGLYFSMFEPFSKMGFVSSSNLRIISGNSFSYFIIQVIFVFSLSKKWFLKAWKTLGLLTLASSLMVIIRFCLNLQPWGLGLNTSTEGAFLAIMMPLMLFSVKDNNNWNLFFKSLPIIAVFLTGSSVGIFGSCLSVMIYLLMTNKKRFAYSLIPISIFITAAYFYTGSTKGIQNELFSDSFRIKHWLLYFAWWLKSDNQLLGTGLGSFYGFGPYIQKLYNLKIAGILPTAHNDWLQILMELGLIGFILSQIVFIKTLIASRKFPIFFSSTFTFGVVAFLNMPLRYPIVSLAGLIIFRIIHDQKIIKK